MAQLVKNLPAIVPWVGKIPWRRERLPTSAFWPGEFHALYSPWGHKELDTTERLSLSHLHPHPQLSVNPVQPDHFFFTHSGIHRGGPSGYYFEGVCIISSGCPNEVA